jgi:hypothetical protein
MNGNERWGIHKFGLSIRALIAETAVCSRSLPVLCNLCFRGWLLAWLFGGLVWALEEGEMTVILRDLGGGARWWFDGEEIEGRGQIENVSRGRWQEYYTPEYYYGADVCNFRFMSIKRK